MKINKIFLCKICGKKLGSSNWLNNHVKKEHKMEAEKYYLKFSNIKKANICRHKGCNKKTRFISITKGFEEHCCRSHANLNQSEEVYNQWKSKVQDKWNSKSTEELIEIKERRNNTIIENYGSFNNFHKLFCEASLINKYGVSNPSYIPETIEKRKETFSNRTKEEKENTKLKRENTMLERFGAAYLWKIPEYKKHQLKKSDDTCVSKGYWLPKEERSDFSIYRNKCHNLTRINAKLKFTEEQLLKTGKCGDGDCLQIDHKYSIKQGYLENISPEVIAHPYNLDIIHWRDNDTKKIGCSISKKKLLKYTI
jgi:hypothetical protein